MMTLLKRVEPEQHMNRWYMIAVQATLLDPIAVICAYGSRESTWQRVHIIPKDSRTEAEIFAEGILKRKLKRGYEIVPEG